MPETRLATARALNVGYVYVPTSCDHRWIDVTRTEVDGWLHRFICARCLGNRVSGRMSMTWKVLVNHEPL